MIRKWLQRRRVERLHEAALRERAAQALAAAEVREVELQRKKVESKHRDTAVHRQHAQTMAELGACQAKLEALNGKKPAKKA